MRPRYLALAVLVLAACSPDSSPAPTAVLVRRSAAAITDPIVIFTDRASFAAAAPGVPVQTFTQTVAPVGPGGTTCSITLDAFTDDACFGPGAVLPGITFSSTTGVPLRLLQRLLPVPAIVLNTTTTTDMVMEFSPAVTAIAMELSSGNLVDRCRIDAYGAAGLLRSETIDCLPGSVAFLGMTSDAPVTRVEVFGRSSTRSTWNGNEFLHSVAFGDVNPRTKADCTDGGWERFGFKNQGQCIRYVETGKDSR